MQGRQKRYSGQVALLLTPCLLLLGSHTQADIDVGLFGIAAGGGMVTSSRFSAAHPPRMSSSRLAMF